MAMEVVCGNCQGRLLIEQSGVVVACPHCGAHLQFGEPATPPAPVSPPQQTPPEPPSAPAPSPVAQPQLTVDPQPAFPEINLNPAVSAPAPAPASTPDSEVTISLPPTKSEPEAWMPEINLTIPPAGPADSPAPPEDATVMMSPSIALQPAPAATIQMPLPGDEERANRTGIWRPSVNESVPVPPPAMDHGLPNFGDFGADTKPINATDDASAGIPEYRSETAAKRPAAAETGLNIVTSQQPQVAVVPRYLFVIVASYASAITLAFLYLWWNGAGSTIDLPDLVPAINKSTGQIGLQLAPETPLPRAYRLKLGESKRYGNVMVTPVKVTKGPLQFTHFLANNQTKPPTQAPVLKLWVKFENVSNDQTFPALDEQLLFRRVNDKQNVTQERSNNYICQRSERKRIGKRVPVYTLPLNGEWLLKDQFLNTSIKPHEEWQTYIPSNDEDLSSLEGPLTWRMHFRKGYNPRSHRGVTTLVEVEFDSEDIESDS